MNAKRAAQAPAPKHCTRIVGHRGGCVSVALAAAGDHCGKVVAR